jgi:hypothetical protein
VLGWTPSKVDPHIKVPSFQDFKSFSERHGSRYIAVKTEKPNGDIIEENKQLGAYWLKWTGRRSYEGIDLVPQRSSGTRRKPSEPLERLCGHADARRLATDAGAYH